MKFFQFFTFTLLAAASAALIIVGMATLHWVTTDNLANSGVFGASQTHSGLRRWYADIAGGGTTDSQSWNLNDCGSINGVARPYDQCVFHRAGSWGLGWGIAGLVLIAFAFVVVALISCVTLFRGTWGKFTAALLMFLAFGCILTGALTYWSHLRDNLSPSNSNLSWSYILYCIGGGLALLTSIVLCLLPHKHHHNTTVVVTQPAVYNNTTTTTTATTYPEGNSVTQPLSPKYPGYTTSSQPSYPAGQVQGLPAAQFHHQEPISVVVQ